MTSSVGNNLEGKVALITGASSGIGRAAALSFAARGACVVAAARHDGEEVVEEIVARGGKAIFAEADVSVEADCERMVESALDCFGRLDFAFNCAGADTSSGTSESSAVTDFLESDWDHLMDVNLKGVWLSMKYELRPMLEARSGVIVNASSVAGLVGIRNSSDDLRNLSIRLTEASSDWTQAEAAWFVLTGQPVSVSSITAEHVARSSAQNLGVTIKMTIEPWASTEKVAKVYEYMRYGVIDKRPRSPKRRNVEIFGFVSRRRRESIPFGGPPTSSDSMPTLGQLMEEWNRENPDAIYTKESYFRKDLERGSKALLIHSADFGLLESVVVR